MEKKMPPVNLLARLSLVLLLSFPLILGGCSYLPWAEEDGDDLAFEDDFPLEDEEFMDEGRGRGRRASRGGDREGNIEDDFFAEDDSFEDSDGMIEDERMMDDGPDGFASVDQKTDRGELMGDVESLQNQQEALISKVRELEEVLSTLEPKIDAATERIEGGISSTRDSSDFLEPEVEDLKAQVARLNEEISRIKMQKSSSLKMSRKRMHRPKAKTPPEYNKALAAYRSRNYDESILLFQNLALSSPPSSLKDNIAFWIGSNYLALEMFDDAILQFETVLNKYPSGNKVHDSRYMLGVSYSKKGETSRAIEVLEGALKRNPTAEVRGKILAQLNNIQ
jgi:TolA-binding protein